MDSSILIEVFLGYCKKGIRIDYREKGKVRFNDLEFKEFSFEVDKKNNNFAIVSLVDNSLFEINEINTWNIEEHDEYIRIHRDNINIFIEEMV